MTFFYMGIGCICILGIFWTYSTYKLHLSENLNKSKGVANFSVIIDDIKMSSLYVQRLVFFSAQIFAQFEYFFKNGGLVGLMRVKK